jgi:methylmalonyl-CoA carboxyltransferase small subunit
LKLKIAVDGKTYEVDVEVAEDEHPSYAHQPYHPPSVSLPAPPPPVVGPVAGGNGNVAEDKVCRSPIAGTVVRVNVHPGQSLQTNDPMMVLEAMKMETNITAPVAGKVKNITVNSGDAVQMNQILVEFE